MGKNNVLKSISTQDLELLYKIYKYRALSTQQIMQMGNLGKWYVYKKLSQLRKHGLVKSRQISGNYIPNQKRQGSYHQISDKCITLLRRNGFAIYHEANDLQISKYRLPYLLIANDLSITLKNNDWNYADSRKAKVTHNLNRNDLLHGTLINPNGTKQYSLYVFSRKVVAKTLHVQKVGLSKVSLRILSLLLVVNLALNQSSTPSPVAKTS